MRARTSSAQAASSSLPAMLVATYWYYMYIAVSTVGSYYNRSPTRVVVEKEMPMKRIGSEYNKHIPITYVNGIAPDGRLAEVRCLRNYLNLG